MLTLEQERQIEIWGLMRPFEAPDFDGAVFARHLERRARKRREYREMRLFDPRAYRVMLERRQSARAAMPGHRSNLRPRDVREVRAMYAAGATIAMIASAFRVSSTTVQSNLAGRSNGTVDGYLHPAVKRRPGERVRVVRGAAHPRAKLTHELLNKIVSMNGSNRAIGRALGVSRTLVADVKAGRTLLQRNGGAQ